MALYNQKTIEFDLIVRVKGEKSQTNDPYYPREKEQEIVVLEELKFNTIDAKQVIRKVLDYLDQY